MFNEEAFERLKASKEFKGFSRNCYIGFMLTYSVFIAAVSAGLLFRLPGGVFSPVTVAAVIAAVLIISLAVIAVLTYCSLNRKKPYLCDYGTVVSKDGGYAAVSVNGTEIRGSSFERFLRNESLDNYNVGDKVLIFSGSKKNARPLFFHA